MNKKINVGDLCYIKSIDLDGITIIENNHLAIILSINSNNKHSILYRKKIKNVSQRLIEKLDE